MKHFFGATPDGRLYWSFVMAGGYDGLPVDLDADDPQDPHALHLLSVYNKNSRNNETLGCVVAFNCPCPPGDGNVCDCASAKQTTAYCKDGVLTDKPACTVLIDGVAATSSTQVTRYPNSLFTLQVVADDLESVDDGEEVFVGSNALLETGVATLTFTDGVTNTLSLRAPAQGVKGSLALGGKLVSPFSVVVKGFATTPG